MNKKALYTGSFDPLTNGHLDIIKRAVNLCEELVIGVVYNPSKKASFSLKDRKEMIQAVTADMKNVRVDDFSGLLADYVNANGFDVVIRGLRATTDFEYEIQMAQMNARLFEERVETIFLMTSPGNSFLSSGMIKEVHGLGGDIQGLVPAEVLSYMNKRKKE